MRYLLQMISIFVLAGLAACSKAPLSVEAGEPVGLIRQAYQDPVRKSWRGGEARPLTTSIWYPAVAGTEMVKIGIPPSRPVFIGGYAARDAELSPAQTKYPLIVMSHGTGGAALQMMWLGRALASQGYIVAAVDHHGNTAAEDQYDARGFRLPWERALDISAVIDHVLADPVFGPNIDQTRIGAVGFSLGGYTVTALAGGILDLGRLEGFCASDQRDATCDDQSEYPEASADLEKLRKTDPRIDIGLAGHGKPFRDERVQAVVALAPALAQAFTDDSLKNINTPMLIISGSADRIVPTRTNASRLAETIPNAELYEIPGAGHYVFLNTCNKRGKKYVPICKDGDGIERGQIHAKAVKQVSEFFARQFGA
ncbi:MAG: alpha/beta fold hydrolase [Robiginitomaculum sp.]|nr:alpha/beta fold hydrolase [Robiginitomaculum sp.]